MPSPLFALPSLMPKSELNLPIHWSETFSVASVRKVYGCMRMQYQQGATKMGVKYNGNIYIYLGCAAFPHKAIRYASRYMSYDTIWDDTF